MTATPPKKFLELEEDTHRKLGVFNEDLSVDKIKYSD